MAFLFSRIGTYVSRIYLIMLVRPHASTAESTHEKKGDKDYEHPDSNYMVSPPPVKVLGSRQSARVW